MCSSGNVINTGHVGENGKGMGDEIKHFYIKCMSLQYNIKPVHYQKIK